MSKLYDRQIKVLVVDDSALVRQVISDILERDPGITVIGTAKNGKTAIFKNDALNPDVITMDIEMPVLDGLEALKSIISTNPKPVIMMSVLTQHGAEATFKALEYGAVDFIPKPSSVLSMTVDDISELLIKKVKSVYGSKISILGKSNDRVEKGNADTGGPGKVGKEVTLREKSSKVIAIGTSTGGPSALMQVFKELPGSLPAPVLVVQHMPEGFTKAFAERLDSSSQFQVKEAEDGDKVIPGKGFVAPGHSHMAVENHKDEKIIKIFRGEKVTGHRPSIDVLFDSVAECYGRESIAVLMTGMGRDGARGMSNISKKGGYTIAQNEETSVVYGMNRVAVEMGVCNEIVSLYDITKKIVEHL